MPTSSDDESEEEMLTLASRPQWELPLGDWQLGEGEEESDYAMLPQIEQAVELMLQQADTPAMVVESRKPGLGLSMEEDATGNNSVLPSMVEGEQVEVAVVDNRNYLQVQIGGEQYLALLDPGATVSLAGPRIIDRFQNHLQPSTGQVKGVSGAPMKIEGILEMQIEVEGQVEVLEVRGVREINHDLILGMDFGSVWRLEVRLHERQWRHGPTGEWHSFVNGSPKGKSLINIECAGLSEITKSQHDVIKEIVERLILKPTSEYLPTTHLTEHHIELTDYTPIRHAPRRRSPAMWQVAREAVEEMYRAGVIERSASAWCHAPVIQGKPEGKYRFCIDFRDLNARSKRDANPLSNMDSILDRLRRAKYISKVDLKNAYFQVPLDEESKQYTAFAVPGSGLWQFKRMPFGLTNAPATFQRLIDALFGPEMEPHVFGYLDDIIIATETFEEHQKWLEVVLTKIRDAQLTVNWKKCEFGAVRVKYLGYVLDRQGLRPDMAKIEPIVNYPVPKNKRQLRRFLGMVGWYSRFIQKESEIKIPLLKLIKKSQAWKWDEEQQRAFEQLKLALTTTPVLARPDFSREFIVESDASDGAIGAVLSQDFEDGEHPIVYIHRVLTAAERNYSTTEKECLALIWAIKKLRPYLEGSTFRAVTDHSALRWLQNLREPTGRFARWAIELQQWDVSIEHRKGAMHHVPDALSRLNEEELREAEVASFEVIEDEWYLKRIEDVLAQPKKYKSWKVEEGMLYKLRPDPILDPVTGKEHWKLVVPLNQRERVMRDAHKETTSGHLGVEKTYERITLEYYWPGLWHEIYDFVQVCEECQRHKIDQSPPKGLMGGRVIEKPWSVVASDLMEFPQSKGQNKYVVVFQDLFTRWIEVRPLRKATGKNVAKAFEELVLFRWGTADYLLTDNGNEFDNKDLERILLTYGVTRVTTPPYHPQANPVERSNRTLKTMIATFIKHDHRDWDQHLHELRHAINTAVQSSTRVSPAFLNYGRHPAPVKSLRREVEILGPKLQLSHEVWADRVRRLDALRDLVVRNIEKAQLKQASRYNRGRKEIEYQVGDLVMRKAHVLSSGGNHFSAKLAPKWEGPYEVEKVLPPHVYVLKMGKDRRNPKVHVSELKKYRESRGLERRNCVVEEIVAVIV